MNDTISILGCGWYGMALGKKLVDLGQVVKGSTTSRDKLNTLEEAGINGYIVNFGAEQEQFDPEFFKCDTLIISLPPQRSAALQSEYPQKIKRIAATVEEAGIKNVLMISSTSVYGDVNREVDESDPLNPDTESGKAIVAAEQIIQSYNGFKVTLLRFGGLIGPGRNLAKFFADKKDITNGLAPVNLLHLDDCVALSLHVINTGSYGFTFNACSPDHPSRKEFYTLVSEISGMLKPDFLEELTKWKKINGNLVTGQLNYKYLVNKWSDFLTADKL
ncbi:nucleoside-diphosphate-sugar epimerase [Pedobacter sp. UYP24]